MLDNLKSQELVNKHKKKKNMFYRIASCLMILSLIFSSASFGSIVLAAYDDNNTNELDSEYTVELVPYENGTLSFSDTDETVKAYEEGDEVTVNIIPDEGYAYYDAEIYESATGTPVEWELQNDLESGGVATNSLSYVFTMPAADVKVVGFFNELQTELIPYEYEEPTPIEETDVEELTEAEVKEAEEKAYPYVTVGNQVTEDGYTTNEFFIDGVEGFCAEANEGTPSDGYATGPATPSAYNVANVEKVMYYGHNGPDDKGISLMDTHMALSYAYDNGADSVGSVEEECFNMFAGFPAVPSSVDFTTYSVETGNGGTQTLMFYEYNPAGYVNLQKVSGNPALTTGNDYYSLGGATYMLDGTINYYATTTSNGTASFGAVAPGTYTLVETSPSKGYAKAPNQTVTVTAGNTTTVTSVEPPMYDPVGVMLYKYDPETGEVVQGGASLAGAVFHFDYYDASLTKSQIQSGNYSPSISFDAETVLDPGGRATINLNESYDCIIESSFYSSNGYPLSAHYDSMGDFMFPPGTLAMYEKSPPPGYTMDDSVIYPDGGSPSSPDAVHDNLWVWDITTSSADNVGVINEVDPVEMNEGSVIKGGVQLTKVDAETGDSSPQGDASLEGIQFDIKNANPNPVIVNDVEYAQGEVVGTIETHWNEAEQAYTAETPNDMLPYGEYQIQEVASNGSYLLTDGTPRTFAIEIEGEMVTADVNGNDIVFENEVVRGDVQVIKKDLETGSNEPQGGAYLSGVKFEITNESLNPVLVNGVEYAPGEVVTTITTHWNAPMGAYTAETTGGTLPYGTYSIQEVASTPDGQANDSYLLTDGAPRTFVIRTNGVTVTADVNGNPLIFENAVVRGDLQLQKWDTELDGSEPIGGNGSTGNDLSGIKFEITNNNANPVYSNGVLYQPGEIVATIETHWNESVGAYTAETTGNALPYGDYIIQEVETNDEYLLTDGAPRDVTIEEHNTVITDDSTGVPLVWENQVIRGDFKFNKIKDTTSDRISTLFVVTNVSTGEEHVIATDPNGEYSSENSNIPHSTNTNANDALLPRIEAGETIPMSDVEYNSGTWFGLGKDGSMAPVDDSLGAMPYGEYTIQEVPTDTNEGLIMQEFTFYIYRQGFTVDLGTVTNDPIIPPSIDTTAIDATTGDHNGFATNKEVTIVDTIEYDGLAADTNYTISGTLMDKDTNSPYLDPDGNPVTATSDFTSDDDGEGKAEVTFTFDGTGLAGHTVVVFEDIYDENGTLMASHADIDDDEQSVTYEVPTMVTTAVDAVTGTHNGAPSHKTVSIIDTVAYTGLYPGETYTVGGVLINKDTGTPYLDPDGNPVTATSEFTVDSDGTGQADVTFTFDGTGVEGCTLVAFEVIVDSEGNVITSHTDINDEAQTVAYGVPTINTTAIDKKSGEHTGLASSKDVTIVDTVEYAGLVQGETYTVEGVVMDKATNLPYLDPDGNEVTSSAEFTVDETGLGTIDVEFTFDGTGVDGNSLVVFESIYDDAGNLVLSHVDISDEEQTVVYTPVEIDTIATNGEDERSKTVMPSTTTAIRDEVDYTGLNPDEEYRVEGSIVAKETGEVINTVSGTFTPEEPDGDVYVSFSDVDTTSFAGQEVVCYETFYDSDGNVVAEHTDIEDEDQTVVVQAPTAVQTGVTTLAKPMAIASVMTMAGAGVMYTVSGRKGSDDDEDDYDEDDE